MASKQRSVNVSYWELGRGYSYVGNLAGRKGELYLIPNKGKGYTLSMLADYIGKLNILYQTKTDTDADNEHIAAMFKALCKPGTIKLL